MDGGVVGNGGSCGDRVGVGEGRSGRRKLNFSRVSVFLTVNHWRMTLIVGRNCEKCDLIGWLISLINK